MKMGDSEKTKKKRNRGRKGGGGGGGGAQETSAGPSNPPTETSVPTQRREIPPAGDQKHQSVPEEKLSQEFQRKVQVGGRGRGQSPGASMGGPPPKPAFSKKPPGEGGAQSEPMRQPPTQQQQQLPQAWRQQTPQQQPSQAWGPPQQRPQMPPEQPLAWRQPAAAPQQQKTAPVQQQQRQPQPDQPRDQPKKDQSWKKKNQKQAKQEEAQVRSIQESKAPSSESSSGGQVTPRFTGSSVQLCPYKGPGTKGRINKIEANYVLLRLGKLVDTAYHYDIAIEPDRPKKLMKDVFEAFRQKHFSQYIMAFDRMKNAYSVKPLPMKPGGISDEIEIDDVENSRKKKFKISIQETEDYEVKMNLLKSKEAFNAERDRGKVTKAHQVLEIILRMAATNGIHVGRQYYWPPSKPIALDNLMELWNGIYHSAVFGRGPLLNVDITNKGFPTQMHVLDLFRELGIEINRLVMDQRALGKVKDHLSGLNISYAQQGNQASRRLYKFLTFVRSANQETFTTEEGQTMTVDQYFAKKGVRLRFPHLPLLHCGPRDKKIYLPAEFCIIPGGQAVMKKLTDRQTSAMIKQTATSTDIRKQKILDILNRVQFNNSNVVRGFGIEVDDKFVPIESRILPAPDLEYGKNRKQVPRDGVWNIRSTEFIVPTAIQNWTVVCLERRPNRDAINDFVKRIISVGKGLNMTISQPLDTIETDDRNIDKYMKEYKGKIKIMLVIIPSFGNVYQKVKVAAETQYGILTQCVKHDTIVRRGDEQTVSNILLKMNSKLNGLNHRIMSTNKLGVLKDGNFIVVGADVTHPSPDQRNIPSIVGVAASYDEDGFKYTGMWRIQDPSKNREMIADLATMMADHLKFYKEKRKVLPHTILYYRDGVGEGDFQNVLNIEFQAIRKAAATLQPNYNPKIVFIVVQKRHHTRFFPGKDGIKVGRNNNVPPGTVVDKDIIQSGQNHFYMVAHQAIQGVAKPTKYCILVDEANMSIDDLQALTYNLCYMFTRCNRSVSYVAPTYYAHLMAARGKVYIEGERLNMNDLPREYQNRLIRDEIGKGHPMFFV